MFAIALLCIGLVVGFVVGFVLCLFVLMGPPENMAQAPDSRWPL